jgi:hypothetical protein
MNTTQERSQYQQQSQHINQYRSGELTARIQQVRAARNIAALCNRTAGSYQAIAEALAAEAQGLGLQLLDLIFLIGI